jgi:acetyl esterase/lipase
MKILAIAFLTISIILVLFVLISQTFLGLLLTEVGLWLAWMPLVLIGASIPFLIQYSYEHPRLDFFLLLSSVILNLIVLGYLVYPFFSIRNLNKEFNRRMMRQLGENYLQEIDEQINQEYTKKASFHVIDYFKGINYKQIEKQVVTVNDVVYRQIDGQELKLNVYYPKEKGTYPSIVYLHGGGWMRGSKDRFLELRVLKKIAKMGYVVFNVNYRLAPEPTFDTLRNIPHDEPTIREMVSDVRSAVIFAHENYRQFRGDGEHFYLFGRSAGAHLALLTAFSCQERFFAMEGIRCSVENMRFSGVIAFYPITDMKQLADYYEEGPKVLKQAIYRGTGTIEENENLFKLFSPINYINDSNKQKIPPIFLAAGKKDRIVDVYQSEELHK